SCGSINGRVLEEELLHTASRRFAIFLAQFGSIAMFSIHSVRSLLALLSVVWFLVAANADAGWGQISTATLTGIVQDSTGAVLPNVTVTVRNTDRNTTQSTTTNETGTYVLPALNPGNYSITAESPGFKTFVREGARLQLNQLARID